MIISSDPKLTYSDPMVTQSGPTHLPLPPHVLPDYTLAISYVKLNFWWWWWWWVVGGGNQI